MNKELWNKILQFDFDNPPGEYGFSTRLANENYWTKSFTEHAILEYKKFMYLAATSDFMVSPSEIIDTVWHQHLIFTQSYQEFCNLIGRQVQHIPSTHNKDEFERFRQAKERTKKLYLNTFGEQPKDIWDYNDMYKSLNLDKATLKIRTFIIIGIFSFIGLTIPFYFILKPVYVSIDNPYFLISFICLTILTLITLEVYNRNKLKQIVNQFDNSSFVYQFQPYELVYMKTQKLSNVIHGTVNELIDNETLKVNADNTIELVKRDSTNNLEQLQVTTTLSQLGKTFYPALLKQLATKPIFWNTANCINAFKKYVNKSKKFGKLFYFNFGVLGLLLMLGFIRLTTGLLRDKPVTQVLIAVVVLTIMMILYLNRLTKQMCTDTIPNLYKNEILPARQIEGNWQWNYFLFETAVLSTLFVPLIEYVDRNNNNNNNNNSGSSCGTSCGSSCGSSCSSCGGCGGGD
jgi:hypothetical protein